MLSGQSIRDKASLWSWAGRGARGAAGQLCTWGLVGHRRSPWASLLHPGRGQQSRLPVASRASGLISDISVVTVEVQWEEARLC